VKISVYTVVFCNTIINKKEINRFCLKLVLRKKFCFLQLLKKYCEFFDFNSSTEMTRCISTLVQLLKLKIKVMTPKKKTFLQFAHNLKTIVFNYKNANY